MPPPIQHCAQSDPQPRPPTKNTPASQRRYRVRVAQLGRCPSQPVVPPSQRRLRAVGASVCCGQQLHRLCERPQCPSESLAARSGTRRRRGVGSQPNGRGGRPHRTRQSASGVLVPAAHCSTSNPYAESRLRPRARRRRTTAWPARVDMRLRKPWTLARLRTFGWYVRFMIDPVSGEPAAYRWQGVGGKRQPHKNPVRGPT